MRDFYLRCSVITGIRIIKVESNTPWADLHIDSHWTDFRTSINEKKYLILVDDSYMLIYQPREIRR